MALFMAVPAVLTERIYPSIGNFRVCQRIIQTLRIRFESVVIVFLIKEQSRLD